MHKYRSKYFLYSILIAAILAVFPFVVLKVISGSFVHKVPVEIMDDSLYYYSRAVELSQGHPFIGNPYILEHRDGPTVAFFVADWIWAAPLLTGMSLGGAIIFNQIFWFVVLGGLLYLLFRKLGIFERYAPWASTFCLLAIYWFEARPIVMQVVFPVFVAFLISLLKFLENPRSRKNIFFCIVTIVLSVYIYTYLTQIIAVAVLLGCLITLFPKFKQYRIAWIAAGGAAVLSIPFLIYTWRQIHAPFYQETLSRIGLVTTHMIGTSAVFYGALSVLPLLAVILRSKDFETFERRTILLVSASLFLALISNIITGKDLELAVHIGRFVELWAAIMLCVCVWKFCKTESHRLIASKIILIFFLLFIAYGFNYQINIWAKLDSNLFTNQIYAEPLTWLANAAGKDKVIFSDDEFASYVPLLTEDYVLFHPNAELQLASGEEITDRYIVSREFEPLSLQEIENDYRKFGGAGNAVHRAMVHNRAVKICMLLRMNYIGIACGTFVTPISLKGESYFESLATLHERYVADPIPQLEKYHANFIVYDKQKDNWKIPRELKEVWMDERFVIYLVP